MYIGNWSEQFLIHLYQALSILLQFSISHSSNLVINGKFENIQPILQHKCKKIYIECSTF